MARNIDSEPWHLDRKVPIALIVALLMQTAGAVWFAASLSTRVTTIERDLAREHVINNSQAGDIQRIETGAARRDQKLDSIISIIQRMDRRLERMEDGK